MQKTVCFTTLGCKVNQYDTQAMLEQFELHGYKAAQSGAAADVYVVNTCKVFIRISEAGMARSRLHEQSYGELSKDFFAALPAEQRAEFYNTLEKFQQFLIKENQK